MNQIPAAPTSAFFWRGQPSIVGAEMRKAASNNAIAGKAHSTRKFSPPIEGRAEAQRAADKRAALLRGGI